MTTTPTESTFELATMEKFRLKEEERRHPVLSTRHNLLVIADEAHRTQYNLLDGFAYHLRQALPNASFRCWTRPSRATTTVPSRPPMSSP